MKVGHQASSPQITTNVRARRHSSAPQNSRAGEGRAQVAALHLKHIAAEDGAVLPDVAQRQLVRVPEVAQLVLQAGHSGDGQVHLDVHVRGFLVRRPHGVGAAVGVTGRCEHNTG